MESIFCEYLKDIHIADCSFYDQLPCFREVASNQWLGFEITLLERKVRVPNGNEVVYTSSRYSCYSSCSRFSFRVFVDWSRRTIVETFQTVHNEVLRCPRDATKLSDPTLPAGFS